MYFDIFTYMSGKTWLLQLFTNLSFNYMYNIYVVFGKLE